MCEQSVRELKLSPCVTTRSYQHLDCSDHWHPGRLFDVMPHSRQQAKKVSNIPGKAMQEK